MQRYTVVLYPEREEGGYSVLVPLLPGCVTQGDSLDEALANAREAIALHVRALTRSGDFIPEEDGPPWVGMVEVEASEQIPAAR